MKNVAMGHFGRTTRRTAATLAATSTLLAGAIVSAPQAHAVGEYSCRVSTAPTSVKIGTSYRVSYTYYKSSSVKSASWGPSNTNPVMQIQNRSTGAWYDAAYNTGATYYVGAGGGVTLSFTRGTANQPVGLHSVRGLMYKAVNGSTTSLMSGSPCFHKINFYR